MTAPPEPFVLAREHQPDLLRRRVAAGELVRVRRGVYRPPRSSADRDSAADERRAAALDHVRATHTALRAPHAFSHESAALVWGIPLWRTPDLTHVLQRSRGSGVHSPGVMRHRGATARVVELEGVPVTSLERTVADCLMTMHPLEGLVVADGALRRGVTRAAVDAELEASARRNGQRRAALVLRLADAGAESVWETWLRYVALRLGLPRPVTQFPVPTSIGAFRVDLAWPDHGVLAEFDGAVKYAAETRRALVQEKRREDAITERYGTRPLRFMAADARNPHEVARRLLSRFPAEVRAKARITPMLPLP